MLFGEPATTPSLLDGFDLKPPDDSDMPPKLPGWQTEEEALHWADEMGWRVRNLNPEFDSTSFCQQLAGRMGLEEAQLVDQTAEVPLGPAASHEALPRTLAVMLAEAERYPEKTYMVLRTPHNSAAFLGGLWYWFCSEQGGEKKAKAYFRAMGNPPAGLVVVTHSSFNVVPAYVLQGGIAMAVGMTAMMLKKRPNDFLCVVCARPFAGGGGGLFPAYGAACGHPYHARCLVDAIPDHGTACKVCSAHFPENMVEKIEAQHRELLAKETEKMCSELAGLTV